MIDRVQKIHEVIEKRYEYWRKKEFKSHSIESEIRMSECQHLLLMIDILQEEPSKFDAAIQEGDDVRYNEDLGCRVNLSQLKRVAKREESVSEELEIAANEWDAKASFTPFYMTLDDKGNPNGVKQDYTTHAESFKAGAKWQKQKDSMPVSEDLEKASYLFACKCHPLKTECSTSSPNPEVIEAFKTGAKWQEKKDLEIIETAIHHAYHNGRLEMKEQMIAKAIEGTARPDDDEIWCDLKSFNFKDGDKVKVIVIKED